MVIDNELHDLGGAASLVVERLVAPVEGMHRVISGRVFKYVGAPGRIVHAVHDGMVGGVYGAIRLGAGLLGVGAGALLANRSPEAHPVSDSSTGSGLQAALNGVWGDELAMRGNALAVKLSIRQGNRNVALDRASLSTAYPHASGHVAVLLHGLGQNERCWKPGLPELLADGSIATPVAVRYNSGQAIADTGAEVAELLEALWMNWPVAGARISLVGYSMGGLVARSAYAAGISAGHEWVGRAADLITVGAPHHGSPAARGARLGSRALRVAATSRPLGEFIETASAGIWDLEQGASVAEVWNEAGLTLGDGVGKGLRQHFIAAVVTGKEKHPVGIVVGDLIVRVASATGRELGPSNVRVLGKRRHFDLLSDPEVLAQIAEWLGDAGVGD
jgi:pimeloyl-ACP methyl ester carboxylesterase